MSYYCYIGDDEDFVLEAYTSDEEIEINEDDSETDENPTTKVSDEVLNIKV